MKMFMVIAVLFFLSLSGCAGRQVHALEAQLAVQQAHSDELQKGKDAILSQMKSMREASAQQQREAEQRASQTISGGLANPMALATPFPSRQEPNIPDNWAWLNSPPNGCDGALLLEIRNKSQYFWQLIVNERDMVIGTRDGRLPNFPPGATVYICLPDTGIQQIGGIGYLPRFGVLQKAAKFNARESFGAMVNGNAGHHIVEITDLTPRWGDYLNKLA